jgi:hypothetical protein
MTDKELAAGAAEQDDDEFELLEVDGPEDAKPDPKRDAKRAPEADEDDEEDDQEEGEDARLSADQRDDDEDGDPEVHRASRREQRRRARERKRQIEQQNQELISILTQQLEASQQRLAALENRDLTRETNNVEYQIRMALADIQRAEAAYKEAVTNMDGERAWQAQSLRDDAMARMRQANAVKQRLQQVAAETQQQARQQAQRPAQPQIDPRAASHGMRWMEDNADWFDPKGGNEDSLVALAVDQAMTAEGKDPNTAAYWTELDKRVRSRLGRKAGGREGRDSKDDSRRGPAIGGRGEPSAPSAKRSRQVHITRERRQALEEIGVWGDMAAMKPYLEEFARYDAQNAKTR